MLEGTELYDVLATAVKNYATTKGEWNSRLKSTAELYRGISEDAEGELVADLIGDYLFTDSKFLERLSVEHQNLFQRLWSEVKYLCRIATAGSKEARQLEKVKKAFEDAYRNTKPAEKSTDTESDGVRYAIREEAKAEVKKALEDKFYKGEIKLTENTPSILLSQKGVRDLPMLMKTSHIRENIFTEEEAKNRGLKVNKNINYHGLGDALFFKVIDGLDGVTEAYRGTKNAENSERREKYFLLVSQYTDAAGDVINIPIYINEKGLYNRVMVDTNKLATVFGKEGFRKYIQRELQKGNLVRIKNRSTQASESTSPINADYGMNTSNTNISQNASGVNNNSMQSGRKNSLVSENQSGEVVGDYNVYGRDVKLASDEAVPVQERQNNVFTEEYDSSFKDFDRQRREDFEALDDADEVGAKQGDVFVKDNTVEVINDQDLQYITNILKDTLYLNPRQVGEIKKIVRDYSSADHPSKTRLKAEIQSKFGTVKFTEKVEEIEAIKKELRGRDIKVSDAIKNDIVDYESFRRSHYRKLSLKEDGTPVDSLYMELTNNYPNLFPEDIINPSDQLQRIAEVVDMDTYNRGEYEVDEDTIQKAVDVIDAGVKRYRKVKANYLLTKSTKIEEESPTYAKLIAKRPAKIVKVNDRIKSGSYAEMKVAARSVAKEEGWFDKPHLNKDTNSLIFITESSFTHAYSNLTKDFGEDTIRCMAHIPEIIENAVLISVDKPKDELKREKKVYTFFGAIQGTNGVEPVKLTVKEYDFNSYDSVPKNIRNYFQKKGTAGKYSSLYDTEALTVVEVEKIKKEPDASGRGNEYENSLARATSDSTISISDLLDLVNGDAKKYIPKRSPLEKEVARRRKELEVYIESDKRERDRKFAEYTQEIDNLMAMYAGFPIKDSQTAIDLQYRIQELRNERRIDDKRFADKLKRHKKSLERVYDGTYATAVQRKIKQTELMRWAKELLGDTSTWQDKKFGISYKVNTLHRNLRDIVRTNGEADYKKADEIYDATAGTYNHNEALLNKESARIKKQFADMKINPIESEYIQMLGEFRHNPKCLIRDLDIGRFYLLHESQIDEEKVERAIELARKVYDDLFERVNAVLREHGMKEIPYHKGYFPHFVEKKQGLLEKWFNIKKEDDRVPDSIVGITEHFRPSKSYQSFDKQREGERTDCDFLKGLDRYVQGALDWIYHIEDIQKRRAIENYIRYTHSEKGVQERIDEIEQSDVYNADEAEAQRNLVFAEAENSIGNFLNDFRTQTNTLAGKKSTLDRDIEELANRQVYSTMKNISGRVTANMVAGSVSSALTNFIPITQSWMQVSPKSTLVAMAETIRNVKRDDGTIEKSDFLTNRLRPSEKLDKRTWDKIIDKAGIMMEVVDNFSAQTIWRSKYNENIQKGMSEVEAIKNADEFSENVMAGRSRGNAPTLFDAKNPVAKIFTAFQLEVNNQYGYMFKDAPRDLKNEGIGKLVKGYATMFIGAYVFNALYSSLVGRDSAFDPIGIVEDLLKDIGAGDEDEKEDSVGGVVSSLVDNVIDELPFVSGIAGGGRIPINSMLPYGDVVSTVKETINDIEAGEWERLGAEWLNPVYYLGLPVGGGQIRKTVQGLSMYNTNGDRPIAGSYTDSGALRFPVNKDPLSVAQAAIFGQWSSKNARDYFDEGRSPLTDKQLNVFVQMGEDMTIQEYWDYLDEISAINKAKKKDSSIDAIKMKVEYIVSLDLPLSKKNILVNSILNRKDPVDLQGFGELSGFAEWDFSMRNEEKYQFLKDNGISYQLYASSEEVKKTYDSDYQWYKSNPEKVTLSKAVAGTVVEYREITRAMNAIAADKDRNGNSIPGSAQKKKLDYVNSLDIDIGAKMILYKLIYTTDTQYDRDVIEYVNDLDLTAAEKKTILKELKLG